MRDHPRQFRYPPQLHLTPPPADLGATQRGHQPGGGIAELSLPAGHRSHLLPQLAVGPDPPLFHVGDRAGLAVQPVTDRLEHRVDRLLPLLQRARCLGLLAGQAFAGEVEKTPT